VRAVGVVLLVTAVVSTAVASPNLLRIRHSSNPTYTRIVADLSAMPTFEVFATEDSSRLLVDLLDVHLETPTKGVTIADGRVNEVIVHDVEEAGVQLEVRLDGPRRCRVFTVGSADGKPDRVVIDVLQVRANKIADPTLAESPRGVGEKVPTPRVRKGGGLDRESAPPARAREPRSPATFEIRPSSSVEPRSAPSSAESESHAAPAAAPLPETALRSEDAPRESRVVVIDPGHGGDDPGATGLGGLVEKEVTLRVATALKERLLALDSSLTVLLTRTQDDLVPLRARYRFAEAHEADLFVSLHTNAAADRRARGAEVFFLSLNPTADADANRLAELENAADLVAGVPPEAGSDLLTILADLQMKDTLTRSSLAADAVLSSLGRHRLLKTRSVDQASFVVLRSAKVPSVLVELGFLTNEEDAGLLALETSFDQLARALSEGIFTYLASAPREARDHVRAGS
jgi:N-acetylmuramoyl-L-alanine amidase